MKIAKVGQEVLVEGRSLLGKNRVNDHGILWKVVYISRTIKSNILVESPSGYRRWIYGYSDKDFKILTICK